MFVVDDKIMHWSHELTEEIWGIFRLYAMDYWDLDIMGLGCDIIYFFSTPLLWIELVLLLLSVSTSCVSPTQQYSTPICHRLLYVP
jgi:hypothetical protein